MGTIIKRFLIFCAAATICSLDAMQATWYQRIAQNLRRASAVVWQRAQVAQQLPAGQPKIVEASAAQRANASVKNMNLPPELRTRSSAGTPAAGSAVDIVSFLLDYNRKEQEELKKAIKQKEIESLGPLEARRNLTTQLQKSISGIHIKKEPRYENVIDELSITVQKQLLKAFTKEEQLLKEGYICFYHSQTSDIAVCSDIVNTVFYKLADQQQPKDFRFIQFLHRGALSESIENIYKRHSELLQTGGRWTQLAVNLFIFANTEFGGWSGSSTMNNLRYNGIKGYLYQELIPDFFRKLGFRDGLEATHIDLINSILSLDQQVHKSGRLLLVAVPQKEIDKNVFPVIWLKGRDFRVPLNLTGKELHKFSDVLEEIKQNAEIIPFQKLHEFEGAIPLSPLGLSNPYSGIKVYTIDSQSSSEQLQAKLERAKAELVDAAMQDLARTGKLEQAKKLARDYMAKLRAIAEYRP